MIYPILLYNKNNKKKLRLKSTSISKYTNLLNLINNMFDTMYYYNGIGLSAPQIGLNIKLFIISIYNKKKVFINPKILKISKKKIIYKEGCLSLPNIYKNVLRSKKIIIQYYNKYWVLKKKKIKNLFSIIYQHEYDHLFGKLILDYK
ncbi:MAG: peptide deformylase [Candidatus Shikimatogenerans sp. JK-2022]|nr:peptide deformylase [Candidatus Shikimatogenerans bostrichidophilus]